MEPLVVVEVLHETGVCNLCLIEGPVKNMLTTHFHDENSEIYSEMLMKCFSIDITTLELGDTKRVICDGCILKLRDCSTFRDLVKTSLQTLKNNIKLNKELETTPIVKEVKIVLRNEHKIAKDGKNMKKSTKEVPTEEENSSDTGNSVTEASNHDDSTSNEDESKSAILKMKDEDSDFRLSDSDNVSNSDTDDPVGSSEVNSEHDSAADKIPLIIGRKKKKPRPKKKLNQKAIQCQQDIQEIEAMLTAGLFPFKMYQNNKYSCFICPEISKNLEDIKNHASEHNKSILLSAFNQMTYNTSYKYYKVNTKLRCKVCKEDINNFTELKTHVDANKCTKNIIMDSIGSDGKIIYNSEIKQRPKRIRYKPNEPVQTKWNSLPFKLEKDQLDCPVCKKVFFNRVTLTNHMNVHYPNHICDNCGKAFASMSRFRSHMRTHEIGTFPCRYCKLIFDKKTKRECHVTKEHRTGIRYNCKICNIHLPTFHMKQKHLAEVHNEELKKYKCNACPKSYITPGSLSSHVRREHLKERSHECNQCDLAFYYKRDLMKHLEKHTQHRNF